MIIGIVAGSPSAGSGPGPDPTLPTTIGEVFGGGYYIGDITVADGGADDGTYAVIMGGLESQSPGTLAWKNPRSNTPGTDSTTNGRANTLAMQANDPVIHYAGMYCLSYAGGDYDDWYLGAKDELDLAWINRDQLTGLAMDTVYFWSSTQYTDTLAWRQTFSNGFQNSSSSKTNGCVIRPVRRLLRTP